MYYFEYIVPFKDAYCSFLMKKDRFDNIPIEHIEGPDLPIGLYRSISLEDYMQLSEQIHSFQEATLSITLFPNCNQLYFFRFLYNYYYPQILHYMINIFNCNYEWSSLNQWDFKSVFWEKEQIFVKQANNFLIDWENNKSKLALNILNNGLYFPFFYRINSKTKIKEIVLGRHRFLSILLNPSLFKNKKFLFIDLSIFFNTDLMDFNSLKDYKSQVINTIKPVPMFILDKNLKPVVYKRSFYNQYLFYDYFMRFVDILAAELFNYTDSIKPNSYFNIESHWNLFINNKFKHIQSLENFY